MQIVINIPKNLKQKIDEGFTNQVITYKLWDATKNGTVLPDNPTNGDMIKAMFPNIQTRNENTDFITYSLDGIVGTCVETKWWNTPYEKGE